MYFKLFFIHPLKDLYLGIHFFLVFKLCKNSSHTNLNSIQKVEIHLSGILLHQRRSLLKNSENRATTTRTPKISHKPKMDPLQKLFKQLKLFENIVILIPGYLSYLRVCNTL